MINIYCIRPKGFNVGNDLIYIAVKHFLRKAFKQDINLISIPAVSTYESNKKAGITAKTVYEINQFGDGLVIGGGNLYENGELIIDPMALKALEVPMMLFSLSRGKVYNKNLELVSRTDSMSDGNITMLNARAEISLTRDIATHEYLTSIGSENILGGCPTLFLDEVSGDKFPASEAFATDALISVRSPSLMSIPVQHQYAVKTHIESIISQLQAAGYNKIKLLCHDHRDIEFASSFKDMEYIFTDDVYSFLSYLKSTKINVSYRLHSFLPCLALDIPAVKISYDQRAISMLDTIGVSKWNINMVTDDLPAEFANRIANLDEYSNLRKELIPNEWKKLKVVIEENMGDFADLVQANLG